MLKSARHHYFTIFPWIRDKLTWKISALVTSVIFRLFVNTLTHDDNYSRRYMQIFLQQLKTPLSQKRNGFFPIFDCIFEMWMKFRTFWKKGRVPYPNYYRNYCIRKTCLLKRLKGLASAHHSVINLLTDSKHCGSHNCTTIFLFLLKRLKGLASAHHSAKNVLTGSKHCWSQHGASIFLLFNEIEIIELENVCLSHNWNLQTVCSHVDSRWQELPSLYADFLTTISKAFISKRNGCFSIFYCISEMCMKVRTLWKKRRVS